MFPSLTPLYTATSRSMTGVRQRREGVLPYAHIFFTLVKPFLPSSNLAECWQNPLVR
jgi:hypothetical protein